MYNRKTINHNIYQHPKKVLQNAGANAFRGFVGGDAFITKKGFKGLSIDSLWSQNIFASFANDDAELATISLKGSLVDIHMTVTGGEFGCPFSIGDYGFYSETQFEEQADILCNLEREYASKDFFLSDSEWQKVDNYLTDVAHYGKAAIHKAVRGDSFAVLAIRKNAFAVAGIFLGRGLNVLLENENGEDLIDILKEQYGRLSTAFKVLLTKQPVFYRQTKTTTELNGLRTEQQTILGQFQGMLVLIQDTEKALQQQLLEIEADIAFKTRCELLNLPFPAEKEINIARQARATVHVRDLAELRGFSEGKVVACQASFQEFEEKLRLYEERKLSLSKAAKRGASRESMDAIASRFESSLVQATTAVGSSWRGPPDEEKKQEPSSSSALVVAGVGEVVSATPTPAPAPAPQLGRLSSYSLARQMEEEEEEEAREQQNKRRILGTLVHTEDTVVYYR